MLGGSSSLPGKHTHTLAVRHRHKARQDGTGYSLCGTEEKIETARERFQLEDKDNGCCSFASVWVFNCVFEKSANKMLTSRFRYHDKKNRLSPYISVHIMRRNPL